MPVLMPGVGVAAPATGGSQVETVIWSDEIDLKVAGEYTIKLTSGEIAFVDEVGILCTARSGVIASEAQGSWGVNGALAKYHGVETLSDLTVANTTRQVYRTTLTDVGETLPRFAVTTAATGAGTLKGKAYMKVTINP